MNSSAEALRSLRAGFSRGLPRVPGPADLAYTALAMWELIFMLLVLKIPLVYLAWVVWWAIRAVPEPGTQGGTEGLNWKPWTQPAGPRPRRGGPHDARPRRSSLARRRVARRSRVEA